jgi:HPt (histidine-containing phosphotransfer) domain-containing protein
MEQPNLSYLNSLSGGDKEFEKKLIQIIKSEFPGELKTYKHNIEHKNYLKASENVHKLKHKISILGLEKSYEIASEFEISLKENEDDSLKEEFEKIMQIITDYLMNL